MTDGLAAGREVIRLPPVGVLLHRQAPQPDRGHGRSAALVIRAMSQTTVDVIGFSLGGMIAQDLTRRHPDLVRKLMLLGTQPSGGTPDPNPHSPPEFMMGQIAANTAFVAPLDPDAPFSYLQQIALPTLIFNSVNDVVMATINA